MLWDMVSTVGSQVIYQCKPGYRSVGRRDVAVAVCAASGEWDEASLLCEGGKDFPLKYLLNMLALNFCLTASDLCLCCRNQLSKARL